MSSEFSMISTGLIARLDGPDLKVALALQSFARAKNQGWVSEPTWEIATVAGVDKSTITRRLATMFENGVVERRPRKSNRGGRQSYEYRLTVRPPMRRRSSAPVPKCEPAPSKMQARTLDASRNKGESPQSAKMHVGTVPKCEPAGSQDASGAFSIDSREVLPPPSEPTALRETPPPKPKPKPKRKASLPADCPTEADREAAIAYWRKHRPELAPRLEAIAEQFRDHHAAKGSLFVEWSAAWRTWYRRQVEFAGGSTATAAPTGDAWTPEKWRAALRLEAGGREWDSRWPARALCPPDIAAEFAPAARAPPAAPDLFAVVETSGGSP